MREGIPLAGSLGMKEVVEVVSENIEKLNDGRPFALLGHSLGALIAFEVAHKLQHKKLIHLFASGMRSPLHYQVPRLRYTMTDAELINYVANTDMANTKKDENYFQYLQFIMMKKYLVLGINIIMTI